MLSGFFGAGKTAVPAELLPAERDAGVGLSPRWPSCRSTRCATTRRPRALGVAREEVAFLGGAQAQIDGEVVDGSLHETWAKEGVVFVDSARGLTEFGESFRPHYGTVIGRDENPFTRLNAAVFSGGSFIYVPPGVKLTAPLTRTVQPRETRPWSRGRWHEAWNRP